MKYALNNTVESESLSNVLNKDNKTVDFNIKL